MMKLSLEQGLARIKDYELQAERGKAAILRDTRGKDDEHCAVVLVLVNRLSVSNYWLREFTIYHRINTVEVETVSVPRDIITQLFFITDEMEEEHDNVHP